MNLLQYYRECIPPPNLKTSVDAFWCAQLPLSPEAIPSREISHRVLPDGCVDLIYRYRRDRLGNLVEEPVLRVYGATEQFEIVPISPGTTFLGVRFKIGRAKYVLDVDPIELSHQEINASECSNLLRRINQQLEGCVSTQNVFGVIQNALSVRQSVLSVPPRIEEAIELLTVTSN